MPYAAYLPDGRITLVISSDDLPEAEAMAGGLSVTLCGTDTQSSTHYVLSGAVVAYSAGEAAAFAARPSSFHLWDVATKSWLDPRPLGELRAARREVMKAARAAAILAGFDHAGKTYQADIVSLQNLNGAVTAAMVAQANSQPYTLQWTAADNSVVTLDAAQTIALGMAAVQHVGAKYAHGVSKREEIDAAQTAAAIEAVSW